MKQTTLCLLLKDDQICLALKKRGFGMGKWNGVGGKVNPNETVEDAACREALEEIGVKIQPKDLEHVNTLKFYFTAKPEWNLSMNVFLCRSWQGEPAESEEMQPHWYKLSEIPYEKMWADDAHWLPKVLVGKKLEGEFYFDASNEQIEKFELREI